MNSKREIGFNEAELRKRAASNEELNIRLTNNYAFQKIFKNAEIVKGFLMALLHLKENEIESLEVTDPFVEGEVEEEKEGILDVRLILNGGKRLILKCRIHIKRIGQKEAYSIIVGCLQTDLKRTALL